MVENLSILLGLVLNVPFFDFRVLIFGENKCKNQFFCLLSNLILLCGLTKMGKEKKVRKKKPFPPCEVLCCIQ